MAYFSKIIKKSADEISADFYAKFELNQNLSYFLCDIVEKFSEEVIL